jgi:hypothetical protein
MPAANNESQGHKPSFSMKTNNSLRSACWCACLWAGLFLWPQVNQALLPQPSFIIYGQILDPYGWPLMRSGKAEIILRVHGREIARVRCNERIGPGLNYFIEVPLDDGRRTNYAAYAARVGDAVEVTVAIDGCEYPVMRPDRLPRVGRAGGVVFHNLSLGTDEDNDGLPDEWEWWLIYNSWGLYSSIEEVRPEDDADGDGVSNWHEYLAGTDPAWALDRPVIEAVQYLPDSGHFGIALFSVPGKTYKLWASADLNQGMASWQLQPITLDPNQPPGKPYWTGTGYLTWLLVKPDASNTNWFIRFTVQ